jgi:coenzyme F420 biosynthesis associated uncharacterized protein
VPGDDWGLRRPGSLIDWGSAASVGARLCGSGPTSTSADRVKLREELAEAVSVSDALVASFTGLAAPGSSAAWTISRAAWIDSNVRSLERVLEPLIEQAVGSKTKRAAWRNKAVGAQMGALFGYISRKVLGQYDPFLPPDDSNLIYFVGPNVLETERRFTLDRKGFRLYVALHEATHRAQFSAAPWLRQQLLSQIETYLNTVELDPQRVMENLRRAVEDLRSPGDRSDAGDGARSLVFSMMTDEQKAMFRKTQGLMALLEGHATYVMNGVGPEHIRDFARMKTALSERRRVTGVEKAFQQTIGFSSKMRQYHIGERFVAKVVEEAGMQTLNAAFAAAENLPSLDEINDPSLWVNRVGRV